MERWRALKSEKFGPTIEGLKKRDVKIKRKTERQKGRVINPQSELKFKMGWLFCFVFADFTQKIGPWYLIILAWSPLLWSSLCVILKYEFIRELSLLLCKMSSPSFLIVTVKVKFYWFEFVIGLSLLSACDYYYYLIIQNYLCLLLLVQPSGRWIFLQGKERMYSVLFLKEQAPIISG